MKWFREEDNLFLYIKDDHMWVRFNNHPLYQKDFEISSKSGFRTAQTLLKLGYKFVEIQS